MELQSEGYASGTAHLEAMEMLYIGWMDAISGFSLGFATAHWYLPDSSEALVFYNVVKATPPDHLVWRPAGFTSVVPQDRKYLHTLKAAAW